MTTEYNILLKEAEKVKDNICNFLSDLIEIPSTSCNEGKVVERIVKEMKKVGFDEIFTDKMGSVVGKIGKGKPVILFDSHIDTVDSGDLTSWSQEPFKAILKENTIFGRGASDNKAAIACMVYGAHLIKTLNFSENYSLYVIGTVQEEDCDGLALKYYIDNAKEKPEYVVLGECTNLQIYRGHRGRVELKITTSGKACHASAPSRGENAVYKMAKVINEIETMGENFVDCNFLGKGTTAVTKIECDTGSLNTVPDGCTIYIDRRLTYGETMEKALSELNSLPSIKETGAQVEILKYDIPSYTNFKVETDKYFPSWILNEEHVLVQAGVKCTEQVLGYKPLVDKWTFSTNGIASMGQLNIPTIGFGPSEEKFAHTPEDQVAVEHLVKSTAFYAGLPSILSEML